MNKKTIAVAFVILSTIAAKPMGAGMSILERTAEFLMEIAPEMAAGAGAIMMMNDDERSDNKMMEPETELVGQDSQGNDIGLADVLQDELIRLANESLSNAVEAVKEKKASGGCSQF